MLPMNIQLPFRYFIRRISQSKKLDIWMKAWIFLIIDNLFLEFYDIRFDDKLGLNSITWYNFTQLFIPYKILQEQRKHKFIITHCYRLIHQIKTQNGLRIYPYLMDSTLLNRIIDNFLLKRRTSVIVTNLLTFLTNRCRNTIP